MGSSCNEQYSTWLGSNEDNKIVMSCYCKQFTGWAKWCFFFFVQDGLVLTTVTRTSDWYVVVTEDLSFVFFNYSSKTLFLFFCVINVSLAIPMCLLFMLIISSWNTVFKSLLKWKPVSSKYSVLIDLIFFLILPLFSERS